MTGKQWIKVIRVFVFFTEQRYAGLTHVLVDPYDGAMLREHDGVDLAFETLQLPGGIGLVTLGPLRLRAGARVDQGLADVRTFFLARLDIDIATLETKVHGNASVV
jgi:hypothetical protein